MKRFLIISIALIINWLGCKPHPPMSNPQPELKLANPRIAPWQRVPERLTFENLTVDNGLSSNSITKLFMDQKGYLWVGTDNGLNRYDGQDFKVFKQDKKKPAHSILDNNIIDIQQDSKGHLWVLSPKGLNEITTDGQIRAHLTDTSFTKHISTNRCKMFLDKKDRLWFSWKQFKFDIPSKRLDTVKVDSLPQYGSLRLFQSDSKGQLWAISDGAHPDWVYRWDEPTQSFKPIKKILENSYYAITIDKEDHLWIGGESGNVTAFNTNTFESKLYRSNPKASKWKTLGGTINNIHYDKVQHALFLANFGAVLRFDLNATTQDTFQVYTRNIKDPFSLSDNIVHDVLTDASGNLWVGTSSAGLCKYSPTKQKFESFSTIGDSSSLASRQIETLLFDNQNQLWIGTDRGLNVLANRQQGLFKTFYQTDTNIRSNFNAFKCLSLDTSENALYCSFWGHFPEKFNLKTQRFEPLIAKNLPNQRLTQDGMSYFHAQHLKLQDGRVAYGVFGGILRLYEPKTQQFYHTNPAPKYGQQWLSPLVSNIFQDKSGMIWLANSEGRGVTKIDFSKGDMLNNAFFDAQKKDWVHDSLHPFGTFTNFKPHDKDSTKLQNGFINTFFEDSQSRFWLGTADGLYWMQDRDKGIFKRYDEAHGFKSTAICAIQEDKHGQFWISTTDAGIAVFDPKHEKVLKTFTKEDGLVSNQFNANVSAQNSNGLMAFGSSKGFNLFHPDSLIWNTVVPTVEIARIGVNEVEIAKTLYDNTIELPHDTRFISITPRVMDLSCFNNNFISYKWVGKDSTYTKPQTPKDIIIQLPKGEHTLLIKGYNDNRIWSEPQSLKIKIKTSFWASPLGYFFIVIIAIFIICIFLYLHFHHIEKIKRKTEDKFKAEQIEKTRELALLEAKTLLAQLNPHFVFNVLTMVQSLVEEQEPQKASETIVELSKLIRNFFESSTSNYGQRNETKLKEISLEREYELLDQYLKFEQMKHPDKFDFGITYDSNIHLGYDEIPPLFLQPYVENAVLHGALKRNDGAKAFILVHFSKIEAEDETNDDIIICTIEDNGIGIEQSKSLKAQKTGKQSNSIGMALLAKRKDKLNELDYDIQVNCEKADPYDSAYPGTKITVRIGYKYND